MIITRSTLFGAITLRAQSAKIVELSFAKGTSEGESDPADAAVMDRAFAQLDEYFRGRRQSFDLPYAPPATEFQRKIRKAMLSIPFGKTSTYAGIAKCAGRPGGARAAGNACGANPIPIFVPCHRVLAAHGIGGFSCGLPIKVRLLNLEKFALPGYWDNWQAKDLCVLMFIRVKGKVLLIIKKRGLGKGKVNAPGGHIEQGETAMQAAVRETQEEVGLTPLHPSFCGRLHFAFLNGYTERCDVFQTDAYSGTPKASPEADPFWCEESALPFDKMWADDRLWVPAMLAGRKFDFRYVFDDDRLLWQDR